MRALLAALLLVPLQAQSEADKLEAALKKFGDRTYRVTEKGDTWVGSWTLKSRIEKDGDRKVAIFEDRIVFPIYSSEVTITQAETATLDGLRLISAKGLAQFPAQKIEHSVSISHAKATLKSEGHTEIINVVDGVKGKLAGLRLVCAAQQKEGAAFKIDVLNDGKFEPGHSFRCVGKESVTVGDKEVVAWKWEEAGEWTQKSKEGDPIKERKSKVSNTYWVGPDGYLLRFTIDKNEMVLDAK